MAKASNRIDGLRLRHLRVLELIDEHRSLRAVGQVLNRTQPAVSQMVKDLEYAFGVELVARSVRGVGLTPAGRVALERARSGLTSLDHLLAELKSAESLSMLFITHDLGVVRQIADRVFVMRQGELVESGHAVSLFAAPREAYTRDLIAAQPEGIRPPEPTQGIPLLNAQSIKVHFPIRRGPLRRTTNWISAVDGVGLELHAGRTIGIVGESGSGKSTLARAITKLVDHQGEVVVDGTTVNAKSAGELKAFRRDVQIVFQDPFGALSPRMSVGDIIAEGLVAHDIGTAEERSRAVAEVLREVGLDREVAGRYPHEFSGGQRQRIAIARTLVLRPRVILFDEPTSALDMTVQKTLIQLLQDLQARYSIGYVFISHDIALIASISHEILVMKDGLVVEQGTAEAIMSRPREDYTRDLITAARRKG